MKDQAYLTPPPRRIDFSYEERTLLNTVIDLLIPADDDFPPPSSLHLIDDFLSYLQPDVRNNTKLVLSVQRLRAELHDLNASADGDFCQSCPEQQMRLLRHLERSEPALYQALWTLANHCYYTRLATRQHISLV
ncbi:MAG: hypothetical protein J2P37_10250 [Ktedonobacteraceae bacterium]|nr:hypothetical protein [Ktedonobacteraceae bacterium]